MKINEENFVTQLKKRNENAMVYVMRTYGGLVKSVVKRHMQQYLIYEEDCINDSPVKSLFAYNILCFIF